jgi:hypothetical protein
MVKIKKEIEKALSHILHTLLSRVWLTLGRIWIGSRIEHLAFITYK